MAKTPTVVVYNPNTGAANTAYNASNGSAVSVGTNYVSETGFMQLTVSGATAGQLYIINYAADTAF
jgi:hypothetical protein